MFQEYLKRMMLLAPDSGGGGGGEDDTDLSDTEKEFETYVLTLPEELRAAAKVQHEKVLKGIRAERAEKKKEAKRRKELEDAEQKRKDAELSDAEQAKKAKETAEAEAAKAKADLRTERLKNKFLAQASKLEYGEGDKKYKFIDPERAYALAVADGAEMAIDDTGKITGVSEALTKLAKEAPYLLEKETPTTKPPSGPNKGKPPGPEQKEQARQEMIDKKRAEYPGL